jgi:hypothetical protein
VVTIGRATVCVLRCEHSRGPAGRAIAHEELRSARSDEAVGLQEELAEAREALAGEMVGAQMVQGELASAREAALQSDQDQQRLTEELATARASLAEAEAALAAPCASADSGEGTETEHLQAELAATRLKLQAARVAAADGHGAAEECTQLRATLTDVRAALKEAQVEAAAARESASLQRDKGLEAAAELDVAAQRASRAEEELGALRAEALALRAQLASATAARAAAGGDSGGAAVLQLSPLSQPLTPAGAPGESVGSLSLVLTPDSAAFVPPASGEKPPESAPAGLQTPHAAPTGGDEEGVAAGAAGGPMNGFAAQRPTETPSTLAPRGLSALALAPSPRRAFAACDAAHATSADP